MIIVSSFAFWWWGRPDGLAARPHAQRARIGLIPVELVKQMLVDAHRDAAASLPAADGARPCAQALGKIFLRKPEPKPELADPLARPGAVPGTAERPREGLVIDIHAAAL
jgi:hypothetical protein